MGQTRLGRLAKTLRWREVIGLLGASDSTADEVAGAVVLAAERRLRHLKDDAALTYAVWFLTRITWAAKSDRFLDELRGLGVTAPDNVPALGLVSALGDHVRDATGLLPVPDHFGEIGVLAFRQALTETIGREGPSLFGADADDARRAFSSYATRARYGELARRFFSAFLSRTIRAFVDRELANHIGAEGIASTIGASTEFLRELDRHVWQSSAIVEDFAGGWYSKHNWESRGQVSQEEAQRFLTVAMRKLRSEVLLGADR